jgi:hypothetical protein
MRDASLEFPDESLEASGDPAARPVLLIGAGRSGTNFLAHAIGHSPSHRNLLEQRYVWTIGAGRRNVDWRHPDEATPAIIEKIRAHFRRVTPEGLTPVDKTPSNALRLEFCLRVFPEARVVHILRDPRDNLVSRGVEAAGGKEVVALEAAGAGKLRRNAAALKGRIAHGATLVRHRSIPPGQIWSVLADQAGEAVSIALTGRGRRYAERIPGFAEYRKVLGEQAAFAAQWRECVGAAAVIGRRLDPDHYLEIRYEELVANPAREGGRLARFLGLGEAEATQEFLAGARSESVGRWRKTLSKDQLITLEPFLRPTMAYLGYEWDS